MALDDKMKVFTGMCVCVWGGGLFCVYIVKLVFVWLQYKKQKWGVWNSFDSLSG